MLDWLVSKNESNMKGLNIFSSKNVPCCRQPQTPLSLQARTCRCASSALPCGKLNKCRQGTTLQQLSQKSCHPYVSAVASRNALLWNANSNKSLIGTDLQISILEVSNISLHLLLLLQDALRDCNVFMKVPIRSSAVKY